MEGLSRDGRRRPIALADWLLLPPILLLVAAFGLSYGGFVVLAADRGEPVRLDRRLLSLWAREACARALFLLLWPMGWRDGPPRTSNSAAARPPVLFASGEATNRSGLWFLETFLRQQGWAHTWRTNAAPNDQGLSVHAERIARQVAQLQRVTGSAQVDVVAFGRGGLAAAWYVRHLGGNEHVRRLVTVGTPWRGTRLAVFSRSATGPEMVYGSHVLDDLAPPPVPTVSIWSPDDPYVVPSTSAVPDGVEPVRVEGAGHVDMLVSARVFRAVQAALAGPGIQRGDAA